MTDSPKLASDPLTDVLTLVGPVSAPVLRFELGSQGTLAFPGSLPLEFGSVVRGSVWLNRPGQAEALLLMAGDCYVLSGPRAYTLSVGGSNSSTDGPAETVESVVARPRSLDGRVRSGKGEIRAELVCGGFSLRGNGDLLLSHLPALIHIRVQHSGSPLLNSSLDALTQETSAHNLGSRLVTESLTRIVLIQMLRTYAASTSCGVGTWLGALTDEQISGALHQIHGDPLRRWTLPELARVAGMSRSSFALRFRTLVGTSPLDYLLRWRMRLAGQVLRESSRTISSLAFEYGYASESAFSASFKRALGCSPKTYRTSVDTASEVSNCLVGRVTSTASG